MGLTWLRRPPRLVGGGPLVLLLHNGGTLIRLDPATGSKRWSCLLSLEDMSGLDVLKALRRQSPRMPVLIFSALTESTGNLTMDGSDVMLTDLRGLTPAQLAAPSQAVAFVLHRDAGDFRCSGTAHNGRADGDCTYAPNPAFAGALAKRGVGVPDGGQQFEMAFSNIGLDYVDELKREHYATPTPENLVQAGQHGASLKQLKAMDAAGYRFGDVPTLVRVRDHGVSARYLEELRKDGYTAVPAEELVKMRDHGVTAGYISELSASGYQHLAPDALARMRDHGVSGSFVAELKSMGYATLTPDDLMRMADHGVRPGFIRTANRDGKHLSPDQLIALRDGGQRD